MFACNLGTTVPLCLQIETFKPGLYFESQKGTGHGKSAVCGLHIYTTEEGQLDSACAWCRLCCSVQSFHKTLDVLVLEPCALGEGQIRARGKQPGCGAAPAAFGTLLRWQALRSACSVPAPAAGRL